ncbi:MAG: manganese efflux pump [Bacteroidales bacterium]|nr:manganese efflux pump [Bacteroidales bacterium]
MQQIIEILLLALALCIDSLVVSTSCALANTIRRRRALLIATTFALFQGAFPLLGALLGISFQHIIEAVDHWIAFGLLAIVGGKMILDAIRNDPAAHNLDISRFGIICLLAISTSIDAFTVGIGMGLQWQLGTILLAVAVIGMVTFAAAMLGIFLGSRHIPVPQRWASLFAGIVLIALGAHTLWTHLG